MVRHCHETSRAILQSTPEVGPISTGHTSNTNDVERRNGRWEPALQETFSYVDRRLKSKLNQAPMTITITSVSFRISLLAILVLLQTTTNAQQPINIGSRRELFVDHLLIDTMDDVALRLHHPVLAPRPTSPLPKTRYLTVIEDADQQGRLYRAYWRGHDASFQGEKHTGHRGETVEYAESRDGHNWALPDLGLHKVNGDRKNNVILAKQPSLLHNFTPFLDTCPDVPPEERFKALAGYPGPGNKIGKAKPGIGLFAFVSADGIHWTKRKEAIPYRNEWRHAFDSQNVSFWSTAEQQYVCYFRTWTSADRLRSISRSTSSDFVTWSVPVAMTPNQPGEHLYTNQTHPYFRAPHIYLALPTRYLPGRGLPNASVDHNNATDILLMSCRAGRERYDRTFTEAFIRPGLNPSRWDNRANYVGLNIIPTSKTEMSFYHSSGDRYVLRTDGFVSVHSGATTGHVTTKPLTFTGSELHVNVSTSAAGSIRAELQTPDGKPIPGLTLADCDTLFGDSIDQKISWSNDQLKKWSDQPVRIRFEIKECDLYSFKFQ